MKTTNIHLLILILTIFAFSGSCEKVEDYSHIVYKNYLSYEIRRATNFLGLAVEGTAEGEYQSGSSQEYQAVIDAASVVDENNAATQEEVDESYQSLLDAAEVFADRMVPFRSLFREIIDYGNVLLSITEEGDQEGNVKAGNKALLQEAISEANQLVSRGDLTQRLLDQGTLELQNAIYQFNSEIIGKAQTALVNPGFELPGSETEDFSEVEGWQLFGNVEEWAPKASIISLESAPEGDYVMRIGSYTRGLYQSIEEMVNPNSEYTLEFDVSLLSNEPDWQGKKYPVILQSRILVFEEEAGDYNFVTVLAESRDTLGMDPGGFFTMSHSVTIDAISEVVGKKVAIDFEQRHTWDAENPIWAESFVAIDRVYLFRKL